MTRWARTAESRIGRAESCRGLFSRLDNQMATTMAAAREVSSTSRMIKRAVVWGHEEFSPCREANGSDSEGAEPGAARRRVRDDALADECRREGG